MTSKRQQPRRLVHRDDLEGDLAKAAALLDRAETPKSTIGARARVWARLAEPEPVRRPWALAAISGATLAIAGGLVLRSIEDAGPVEVIGGADVAIVEKVVGSNALSVRTKDRPATLMLDRLVLAELTPDAQIIATTGGGEVAIELISGGITTAPLEGTLPRMRLSTRPFTIEGDGVRARMVRVGERDVQIEMLSGSADLIGPAGKKRLQAGEKFDSAEKVSALEPKDRPEEQVAERHEEPAIEQRSQRSRVAKAIPEHRAGKKRSKQRPAEAQRVEEPRAEENPTEKRDDSRPDVTPAIPEQPKPTDWAALYREATQERDPNRAIPMFDRLSKSGSAWAEVSAFQAGRLEMRVGRCRDAITRFMPLMSGTYDAEARLDVIECQLALGDLVGAERSLDHFLNIHPKNERQADLRFLRAELARKRNRCVDAIADYESAQSSRHADDAMYFAAWCMLHVGRNDAGVEALRRYLERFPSGRHAGEAKKKL